MMLSSRDAHLALVREPHAERARRRHNGLADTGNRAFEHALVPSDVAHDGRVVGGGLRGGLHVADVLEAEVVDAEPAKVAEPRSATLNAASICLMNDIWANAYIATRLSVFTSRQHAPYNKQYDSTDDR